MPVVMFTSDSGLVDELSPCADEVDLIFTHPLEAILDPELARSENLSEKGSEYWKYEDDLYVRTSTLTIGLLSDYNCRISQTVLGSK